MCITRYLLVSDTTIRFYRVRRTSATTWLIFARLVQCLTLTLTLTSTQILHLKILQQTTFKLLRPTEAMITKWRKEACSSGRFVEISTETEQTLDLHVASELRGLEVGDYMTVANLKELADLVGAKKGGNKPELITRLRDVIQEINDTGTAVVSIGKGPIPWVLTDDQVLVFNNRCRRLVVPPHIHAFCTTKEGLFDDNTSCWRLTL